MNRQYRPLFLIVLVLFGLSACASGGKVSAAKRTEQADAIRRVGEAYLSDQDYTMALSKFLDAEKLNPKDYVLQQDLGIAYMAKGELETAVDYFNKALKTKPDYAMARNNLGVAYLAMENWDAAIDCFKLLTKDLLYATPHFPLSNLGRAYYEKKRYAEAEKYYLEALDIMPNYVNALYGLGKTYLSWGKVQEAARYFEMAVEKSPDLVDANFEMAEAYRLLGNTGKARIGYERVVALSPDSDLAEESRKELLHLR